MTRRGGVKRTALVCALAAMLVAGLADAAFAQAAGSPITVRRGAQGIPHILAKDFEGAGYGYGYSFAQDNICVIADAYVTVRGERSRFFGPDEGYVFRGNGASVNNLNSDFFFKRIIDTRTIEKLLDQAPPSGPRPEVRELVRGYVAGYNEYLRATGVDKLPDPTCRGKPWVREIEEIDAYRRFYQLALLASGGVGINGIGSAQPPTPPLSGSPGVPLGALSRDFIEQFPLGGIGSNAIGLGREATANGKGMLLGNPHFPWDGSERFYQAHLTIPGKLDVSGGSLFGVPLVLIGHTKGLAWSHTVSTAFRFTPFELKLVPGSPTTYLVDGQPREMKRDTVTVKVPGPDGQLQDRTRTLYSSEYGPMFTELLGQSLFPWTSAQAYSMGDANAANFRYLNHFFENNLAQTVREYDAVHRRNQGIPWVNSIAADSKGEAYYADLSVVPNVTNAKAEACNTALGRGTYQLLRLPVLDGSRSECNWGRDDDAIQPGTFGPKNLPSLFRNDYVTNSNDSYWLSNPAQRLEGFARIIGDERTARAPRTRLGLRIVQQRLDGSDGLPGKRFTLQQLQDAVFNNRQYLGELWRDELVAMCNEMAATSSDVAEACPALAAWNLRDDLDSNGAILFRRFAGRALGVAGGPYRTPFSPDDPVNTPSGLDTTKPDVRKALTDAIADLRGAKIPLDAPLRGYQYEKRGEERIPIHGGPGTVGVFNAINVPFSASEGYPNVPHGSSFVQAVSFTDGCPQARTILTYSQSTNPESPYFADQTRMYADKRWVTVPFCESEIRSDPGLTTTVLRGPTGLPGPGGGSCLPRSLRVGDSGVGALRVGLRRAAMLARVRGVSAVRGRRTLRFCVTGGGRVVVVFSRPGRAQLVVTDARRHRARSVGAGTPLRTVRRAYPRLRRVARGVYRAGPTSGVVFGIGRGRVRYVAVAERRLAGRRGDLRAALRRAGRLTAPPAGRRNSRAHQSVLAP